MTGMDFVPPDYKDSMFKELADDLENRFDEKMEKSSKESRKWNLIIITIGIASLIVGIISLIK